MRTLALALLAIASVQDAALADETGTSHVAPVLPTIKLEANTSGKARFRVGVDYTTGWSHHWDKTLSISYQTTTSDGVAQLFSVTDDVVKTPSDYQFIFGGTLTMLRPFVGVLPEKAELTRRAFVDCVAACKPSDESVFCKTSLTGLKKVRARAAAPVVVAPIPPPAAAANPPPGGAAPAGAGAANPLPGGLAPVVGAPGAPGAPAPNPAEVTLKDLALTHSPDEIDAMMDEFDDPTKEYCPTATKTFALIDEATRDRQTVLPQTLISGAFSYGRTALDYLKASDTDATMFKEATSNKPGFSLAGSAVYDQDGLVIELGGKVIVKQSAVGKKLHYCIPGGTVTSGSSTGDAETCNDRTVGAPSDDTNAEIWLLLGAVNANASSRFSIGPYFSRRPVDGTGDKRAYGIRVPMMLSTDILPGVGVYKGMLRITPSLSIVESEKDDSKDARFVVTLEVLTSRSLLTGALDNL